jgi:hypothetical protein
VQYDGGQSERNRRDHTNREQRPHAAEYNVSTSFALVPWQRADGGQFSPNAENFLSPSENWAERAARLGWDAIGAHASKLGLNPSLSPARDRVASFLRMPNLTRGRDAKGRLLATWSESSDCRALRSSTLALPAPN